MKKVTLIAVVILCVLCGIVLGLGGPRLVGAGAETTAQTTTLTASCSDLPNVEACILIKNNGKVVVEPGSDKRFRKPKQKDSVEEAPGPPVDPAPLPKNNLPDWIKNSEEIDKYPANYKEHTFIIYAGSTCMNWNGAQICW